MKHPILRVLACALLFVVPALCGAETLVLAVHGQPATGAGLVPQRSLMELASVLESAILDQCFDEGFIITTLPPRFMEEHESAGAPLRSVEEIRGLLLQTDAMRAGYLVLVFMESGSQPRTGLPPLVGIRYEVHRLGDGTVVRKKLDRVDPEAPASGRILAKQIGSLL